MEEVYGSSLNIQVSAMVSQILTNFEFTAWKLPMVAAQSLSMHKKL